MAKKSKPALGDIFKRTEPKAAPSSKRAAQDDQAPTGRTISVGVGLKESEVAELDRLAAELGVARNGLMGWALRRFLADVRGGRLDMAAQLETTTSKRLRNP